MVVFVLKGTPCTTIFVTYKIKQFSDLMTSQRKEILSQNLYLQNSFYTRQCFNWTNKYKSNVVRDMARNSSCIIQLGICCKQAKFASKVFVMNNKNIVVSYHHLPSNAHRICFVVSLIVNSHLKVRKILNKTIRQLYLWYLNENNILLVRTLHIAF